MPDGGGLADADPGAEHELHEVGQVEPGRDGVGGEAGLQVAGLGWGQGACLAVLAADGSGVTDRVVADRAVAHGVGAQAGQRPAGGAGRLGSLGHADEAQGAVDDGGGELAEADLTERGLDVEPGRGRVQLAGGRSQRARLQIGRPQADGGSDPGPCCPVAGGEGRLVGQRREEPALGLGPAGSPPCHRPAHPVEAAEPRPGPHPSRAWVGVEVDVPVGTQRQRWTSHPLRLGTPAGAGSGSGEARASLAGRRGRGRTGTHTARAVRTVASTPPPDRPASPDQFEAANIRPRPGSGRQVHTRRRDARSRHPGSRCAAMPAHAELRAFAGRLLRG